MSLGASNIRLGLGSTPDWSALQVDTQMVMSFLTSLDANRIQTGFVTYDPQKKFALIPRSNLFNNRLLQSAVNFGNENASFEATQKGFLDLKDKIVKLKGQLDQFSPSKKDEVSEESQEMVLSLIQIQNAIQRVAQEGLKKLRDNYINAKKGTDADSLLALGKECFRLLDEAEGNLENKLLVLNPDLTSEITLQRYAFNAKTVLEARESYRDSLRKITVDAGVVIPEDLVTDAHSDSRYNFKFNRAAVVNAARAIRLSSMANTINALDKSIGWVPLRLVMNGQGKPAKEEGVVGTCEELDAICNLYYRKELGSRCVVMSGGALDTPNKVALFLHGVNSILKSDIKRWVVHQLFSFNTEKKLIDGMEENRSKFESGISGPLNYLHFNTSFRPEKEVTGVQLSHNFKSLKTLYTLTLVDIKICLESILLDRNMALLFPRIKELLKDIDTKKVIDSDASIEILSKDISPFIEGILNDFKKGYFDNSQQNVHLERVYILLQAIYKIISSQLEEKKGSHCNEIEFFLFIYRVLGMNVYIGGSKGLDRSAAVRAFADAQSQLEEEFFSKELGQVNNLRIDARAHAQTKLFKVLHKMEDNRKILFKYTEKLIKEGRDFCVISDLKNGKKDAQGSTDFRSFLLSYLKQADLKSLDPSGTLEIEDLENTLRYLELVCRNLLSVEGEKTLFSTGVVGFRYDQDANTWTHTPNDLPLHRLPPFIRVDNGPYIKLLDYSEGGWVQKASLTLTPAGRELLLRLSQLRKK